MEEVCYCRGQALRFTRVAMVIVYFESNKTLKTEVGTAAGVLM